jgi:hypothetical protein
MKLTILAERILPLFLVAFGPVLSACSGLNSIPTETPALSITDTPTPTIIWFPSTNTPTFFPTPSPIPTEVYNPGVGNLIFSDSFNQPGLWNTSSSAEASALVTRNRLILSISKPGPLSIISLRSQPVVGDFYAEAIVDISLCSGNDQYGMLFRASSSQDFYRLTVNCSGQLRLERVRAGETYPLFDWLSTGDIPLGAPAEVRMGVCAVDREMRIFLNDHFQATALDPVFSSGTLGFFIFTSGGNPVTVSFSNLSVYSVSYIFPTPSLTPSLTPLSSPIPNP